MGYKREITGKAVIYTAEGVKVVDAEVRRWANVRGDWNQTVNFKYPEPYLMIGYVRTIPTEDKFAMHAYHPEKIPQAVRYTQSKFFRLMLDLMRLAQWEPIHDANTHLFDNYFKYNVPSYSPPIDWDAPLDEQFYRYFKFSKAMIEFVEGRYHDVVHDGQEK